MGRGGIIWWRNKDMLRWVDCPISQQADAACRSLWRTLPLLVAKDESLKDAAPEFGHSHCPRAFIKATLSQLLPLSPCSCQTLSCPLLGDLVHIHASWTGAWKYVSGTVTLTATFIFLFVKRSINKPLHLAQGSGSEPNAYKLLD